MSWLQSLRFYKVDMSAIKSYNNNDAIPLTTASDKIMIGMTVRF